MGPFHTIAIIDDDPSVTSIFEFILKQVGYKTITAPNSKQGIQLFKNHSSIDVLFLDVKLPDIILADFIRDILTLSEQTKIILMYDYTSDYIPYEAYDSGAFATIFKPFDVEEVLNQIKKIIQH